MPQSITTLISLEEASRRAREALSVSARQTTTHADLNFVAYLDTRLRQAFTEPPRFTDGD